MAGGELVDQSAIHLLVKREVKAIERAIGVPEACLLVPPGQQLVLPPDQLVADEGREEVERGEPLGLGVPEPGLQDIGHAGEAELAEGAVEFDEIHDVSPVLRSMRSR